MKYQNPKLPEGINVSKESPWKDFFTLGGALVLGIVVLVVSIGFAAEWFARYVPLQWEAQWMQQSERLFKKAELPRTEQYLQEIVDGLQPHFSEFDYDIPIRIQVLDEDIVNAFATLGGQLWITRGMLEQLPDENTLTMLVGHEMGHLYYRDPIKALGRNAGASLVYLTVGSTLGSGGIGFQQAGVLTSLSFSREQERRADVVGYQAVTRIYQSAYGVVELFAIIANETENNAPPAWFSTHPATDRRGRHLAELSRQEGFPRNPNAAIALPEWFGEE